MTHNRLTLLMLALAAQVQICAAPKPESKSPEAHTEPALTVYVYEGPLPAAVGESAAQELARIYRVAGVAVDCVRCSTTGGGPPNDPDCRPTLARQDWVSISVVTQRMVRGLSPVVLGIASVYESSIGRHARVCYDCLGIQLEWRALPRSPKDYGRILGALMAHEIYHLVVTREHSYFGLMCAQWNSVDFQAAAAGQMLFISQQAQQLRAEVRSRMISR